MKLEDVMTTQEAGARWNVPADSIKQCCLKRYANKQFTDNEARKSGEELACNSSRDGTLIW